MDCSDILDESDVVSCLPSVSDGTVSVDTYVVVAVSAAFASMDTRCNVSVYVSGKEFPTASVVEACGTEAVTFHLL